MCAGLSSFPLKPPYHMHNFPALISAATGLDIDEDGLTQIARRNRTLLRAINVRRGMRRADEQPPDDHWRRRFPELESQLLDAYYQFRGWNEQGVPTRESLTALGLDDIARDFEQRGILPDGQSRQES
jgi:aldehyde:ferredoxin oxidoreductase